MNALHRWPKSTIRFIIVVRCTPVSRAVDRRVLPSTRWCRTSICFSRGRMLHTGVPFRWGSR